MSPTTWQSFASLKIERNGLIEMLCCFQCQELSHLSWDYLGKGLMDKIIAPVSSLDKMGIQCYPQFKIVLCTVVTRKLCQMWKRKSVDTGFWLNVTVQIIRAVLFQEETIEKASSVYINDVYVTENVVPVSHIAEHLSHFDLISKDPEHVAGNASVLGLTV